MEKKRLEDAIKDLNASGLIEKPVKFVAVKMEKLILAFMAAVEGVPTEKEKELSKTVVDVYNEIADEQEGRVPEAAPEEPAEAAEPTREEVKKAAKKEKAAKVKKDKPIKEKAYTRAQSLCDSIKSFAKGADAKEIITKSAELYTEKRGEELNIKEAGRYFYSRIDVLVLFGVLIDAEGKFKLNK